MDLDQLHGIENCTMCGTAFAQGDQVIFCLDSAGTKQVVSSSCLCMDEIEKVLGFRRHGQGEWHMLTTPTSVRG
jgi:hypothetical protein